MSERVRIVNLLRTLSLVHRRAAHVQGIDRRACKSASVALVVAAEAIERGAHNNGAVDAEPTLDDLDPDAIDKMIRRGGGN
jgi:hypothetical protein